MTVRRLDLFHHLFHLRGLRVGYVTTFTHLGRGCPSAPSHLNSPRLMIERQPKPEGRRSRDVSGYEGDDLKHQS